jgi:PAS domain S-box-containing protein
VSAGLLLIIAVSFVWLTRRIVANAGTLIDVFEPARRELTEFQISFLNDVSAGRAVLLHPAPSGLAQLPSMQERTQRILDSLDFAAERIGPFFVRGMSSLHDHMAVWRAARDSAISGHVSLNEYMRRIPQQEALVNGVVSIAAQLETAVSIESRRRALQIRNLERLRVLLLGALFPLAVIGTVLTAWFGRQAVRSEQRVIAGSDFEAMLRDSMAALTGAEVRPIALNRIASNAMQIAEADCAFIEQADATRAEVEIVGAAGSGAPTIGTRVAFPESLTDAIVQLGAPEFVFGFEKYPGNDAPERWKDCPAMVIPLQEDGDADGALVLVRRDGFEIGAEKVARIHSLGVWATVALRRKRLASQLELERARLEAVISEVPVGVVLAEAPSGRIVSLNRKAVDLWGSPANPPRAIEEYHEYKVYHPDGELYETHERPLVRAILKGEAVQEEEALIERPDGVRSIVRFNSAPIRDSRGVISAGVSAVVDITKERQREDRSRLLDDISRQLASTLEYDATFKAALNLLVPRIADAALVYHREGDVLVRRWQSSGTDATFDRGFRDIEHDYPLEVPSAHPVAVAVRTGKAQLHDVVDEQFLKTIARNPRELEQLMELKVRSSMTVPLTVRGKTIGAVEFLAIQENRRYTLTDLALAEEVTNRIAFAIDNASLFRSVKDSAHESKFLLDTALAVSGSLEHDEVLYRVTRLAIPFLADFTLAYLRDESGSMTYIASAHRDPTKALILAGAAAQYRPDPDNPGGAVSRALSTGQPVVVDEITPAVLDAERVGAKAREAFEVLAAKSWMVIPLVARDAMIGALVFVSTSADRKYRGRELRIARLLAGHAALATQNALLYRKEHDALITRDEVLGIVSHDLRNPLHTIGMSAQVLRDTQGDEGQRRKHLEIIVRAKDRMDRLIQDLLDVVRIKRGSALAIEFRREPLPGLVQEACQQFVELAREKDVRLTWNAPRDTPDVMMDRGRIIQVLTNLIGNALKFTPAGGQIEVGVDRPAKGVVRVFVRDSGPGIAAESLERIFDPFWQAPRAKRLGTGLGLTISRGIVQRHGGRIWVESREGAGSTFYFTLPVAEGDRQQIAAD